MVASPDARLPNPQVTWWVLLFPEDMDVIGSILLDQSEPLIKEVDKIIEKAWGY